MFVHVHVLECTFLLPPTVRGDWDIVVYAAKTDRTAIILRGRRQYLRKVFMNSFPSSAKGTSFLPPFLSSFLPSYLEQCFYTLDDAPSLIPASINETAVDKTQQRVGGKKLSHFSL